MELNFDNSDWEMYADKFEEDLANIIGLAPTVENLKARASFLRERLVHSPPSAISELYSNNRFFERAKSDLLEASKKATDRITMESVYGALSDLYTLRAQLGVGNFRFLRTEDKKHVVTDIRIATDYANKAWMIADQSRSGYASAEGLIEVYVRNADTVFKLGNYQDALNLYESLKKMLYKSGIITDHWQCPFNVGWANVYLKLREPNKALGRLNRIQSPNGCEGYSETRQEALRQMESLNKR